MNDIRAIEVAQLELLKMQSEESNNESKMAIYQSVALILSVLTFVAPLIIFIAVKTSMSGESYIEAIAKKSHRIAKEQRRAEKLILKLLPPIVATRLIEQKRVSFNYDASTIMFCSLDGFAALVNSMDPMKVIWVT